MAAMFGLGISELLIVGLFWGAPIIAAIVLLVVWFTRSGKAPPNHENLLPCPDCERMVSPQAVACPECGRPLGEGS